jgi:hypothetical protein
MPLTTLHIQAEQAKAELAMCSNRWTQFRIDNGSILAEAAKTPGAFGNDIWTAREKAREQYRKLAARLADRLAA